ncbi:MAG: IS1634 family transposase [Planctomycetes bacterium]|nr:IS1634 family transposase [Planctomycetota bacterium]
MGGKTYEYLRIVENYRDRDGRMKQRVVGNLGRLDELAKDNRLDSLVEKLRRFCTEDFILPREIATKEAVSWGQVLVARRLWEHSELDRIVKEHCQGKHGFEVAERAFVLVANRLSDPKSEHGLARWLDSTYVCDSKGKRFLPDWLPEELVSKEQRVKVSWNWLNRWYRTLDAVYEKKDEIEKELFLRLRDLLNLKVDLVFYDITSVYFERREPVGKLRKHGKSRDGKPREVQVLVGFVMVAGFPIASHIFAGNESEKKTVAGVVKDVDQRFGLRDIIFVADTGMVSPANRELFESLETYHYLLGHPGRRNEDARQWLGEIVEGRWRDCGRGTRVQEVKSGREGVRVFIADSEERKRYETRMRERSMARAEEHLKKVQKAVAAGRLKKPDKIGAHAARALQRDKGYRYFSYRVPGEGQFEYFRDEEKLQAETLHEGRYILTTDHVTLDAQEAVSHYKQLSDLEDSIRAFKDLIEGRPVWHKKDERICAHLFIAQLALFLLRVLRELLDRASLPFSPKEALEAVKSLGIAILDLNGNQHVMAAGPKRDARRVFAALGIENLEPPGSMRNPPLEKGGKAM